MRARALSAVIQDIRTAGFISYNAVARELNRRGVPTLRHGKRWYPMTVSRLLVRLSKMKPWPAVDARDSASPEEGGQGKAVEKSRRRG
jgi:hypothetical protein